MSSNAERAPNAGAQAGIGALLTEIGKRAPSPTQAVKVCQILGFATRENIRQVREIAENKAVSRTENKQSEGEEMKVGWGYNHYDQIVKQKVCKLFEKIEDILRKVAPDVEYFDWDLSASSSRKLVRGAECKYRFYIQACLSSNSKIACEEFKNNRGLPPLEIHVFNSTALIVAKKFARKYEKRAASTSVVCVSILKDY